MFTRSPSEFNLAERRERRKFENGVASSELMSIDGTDELHNLQCKGKFATISHSEAEYEFNIT